jgi:hypothetical protein
MISTGVGGSQLLANVKRTEPSHWYCEKSIDWFLVSPSFLLFFTPLRPFNSLSSQSARLFYEVKKQTDNRDMAATVRVGTRAHTGMLVIQHQARLQFIYRRFQKCFWGGYQS